MFKPSQVQDSSTQRDAARPHRSSPQQAASTAARVESRVGPWGPLLAQLVESVYICLQCQGGSVVGQGVSHCSFTKATARENQIIFEVEEKINICFFLNGMFIIFYNAFQYS